MALLRDLHDLYLIITEVQVACAILKQGETALNDKALVICLKKQSRNRKAIIVVDDRNEICSSTNINCGPIIRYRHISPGQPSVLINAAPNRASHAVAN